MRVLWEHLLAGAKGVVGRILMGLGAIMIMTAGAAAVHKFNLKAPREYFYDPKSVALLNAALSGDLNEARELVKSGADPNSEGPLDNRYNRIRLLHYAIASKNQQAIKILIQVGADPELNTLGGGGPALLFAVSLNDLESLSTLIDLRPIKSLSSHMLETLLFESVVLARPRCIELLLKKGAPVDFRDEAGFTMMMRAIDAQDYELVEYLLRQGASVDIEAKSGMTPAYSIQYDLQKFRAGSETHNKVVHIKELMEARGAVFPALSPQEIRRKRGTP